MRKKGSILSKLLTSYIIIVAIPLIGFIAMYSWMASSVESYALRMNEEIISNAYEKINEIVGKVNSSQLSLAANTRVSQVAMFKDIGREEDFECYLLQKELAGLLSSNEDIYHIYIYFPQSDICVFETTTMKADEFFKRYYGMEAEESAQWKEFLLKTRYEAQEKKRVTEGGNEIDCIEFLQKYPITEKKISGICVVSVRMDKLFAPLIRADGNSEFMVVNRGDNVLFENVGDEIGIETLMDILQQEERNRKDVIISEKVLKSAWKLYSITDREKVLVKLMEIRTLSMILLVGYAIICWCLIRTLTKRNYEPLQKLLLSISDSRNVEYEKNTNEYEWIQAVWASTREDIRNQRKIVIEKFLHMLLKGRVSEKEWQEKCAKYSIHPVGEEYVVLCFKITESENLFPEDGKDTDEHEELELAYFIINNIAVEMFQHRFFVLSVNMDDSVVLILNYADDSEWDVVEKILSTITEIKSMIKEYFRFDFLTVISEGHRFYHGIHACYKQVQEGLEHRIFYSNNAVIEYAKIEESMKLISKLMSNISDSDNIDEMKKNIYYLLEQVCSNHYSKSGSDTTDKVVAFIEENYADSQLSITSIAEAMNLHPVYLGSLFKERTGEKLLDYIAGYRIEKAKSLMREQPDAPMEDIGKMVGYDNVRTFARVFKKYKGITPAQYKKGSL